MFIILLKAISFWSLYVDDILLIESYSYEIMKFKKVIMNEF